MTDKGRNPSVHPALVAGSLVFLAVLLYANTIGAELVYDDKTWLPALETLHDPWNFVRIWSEKLSGEFRPNETLYRPFTSWTLALNWRANEALGLPGPTPAGYHVVNLLLHAAAGGMVYRFLCAIGLEARPSLATALLFVAHPVHTESIASIINRAEPLALISGLAFLTLHRRGSAVPAALCYLGALWSKESAIAFLPIAIAMDLHPGGPRKWRSYGLYALALLLWIGTRHAVVRGTEVVVPFISNPLAEASSLERVLTASRVQLDYLVRLVAPVGLSSDYSYNQIPVVTSAADPRVLGFLALLVGSVAIAWFTRRSHPWVALGVLGYACLFAPTSNFVFPIGTIMGERFTYAPSVFFFVLIGFGLRALARRHERAAVIAWALVLAVLSWLTVERNRTWRNEEAFFRAMVRSAPNSAQAQFGVACIDHPQGRLDEAIEHYQRAIAILPGYREAWNNLAAAYRDRGELETAVRTYEHLLSLDPDYAWASYGLGLVFDRLGQTEKARQAYERTIHVDPTFYPAYDHLGQIHAAAGRTSEAEAMWRRVLELSPGHESARRNLELLKVGEKRRGR